MIGTFKIFYISRPLWTHLGASVGAPVAKGIDLTVVVAGNDNPITPHPGGEEITDISDLALMS